MVRIISVSGSGPESNGKVTVSVSVEGLRTLQYAMFYVLVATGIFLTAQFSDLDWEDNIILNTFGANNICVNFDHPPATYVLPFLWAVNAFAMVVERLAVLLRLWLSYQSRYISCMEYYVLTAAVWYQILSYWFFSTAFAVQPHDLHTLRIHTVPYTNLVLALAVMAMTNVWFATRIGYEGYGFPAWLLWAMPVYIVLLVAVSAHQVIHQAYPLIYGRPWLDAPFPLNLTLGNVWLLLVIVLPPIWNGFLNCKLSDQAVQITMDLSLSVGGKELVRQEEPPLTS